MNENNGKSLIIVGNGYDLALGRQTSYTDFLTWLDHGGNDPKGKPFKSVKNDADFYNFNNVEAFLREQVLDGKIYTNFWYEYLQLVKYSQKNWNNLENQIKNVLLDIEIIQEKVHLSSNGKNLKKYDELTISQKKTTCLLLTHEVEDSQVYSYLMKQLNNLENMFKHYLYEIDFEVPLIGGEEMYNYLIKEDSDPYVLNFNYSTFDLKMNGIERNIHGHFAEADSQLIFGVDSTSINPASSAYQFTKTARIMKESVKKPTVNILNKSISTIKFIGHSLADADFAYFEGIFKYLNLDNYNIALDFYYTKFQKDNPMEMDKYMNAIQTLLEKYSHGTNLVSRLLIENRLNLIDISI